MESILVIDDEKDIHYSFQRNFVSLGWNLLFATSGEEGLDLCAQYQYDLIFIDYKLPGLNGQETTLRIRAAHQNVLIIGMSAILQQSIIEACYEAGMDDFIAKPISQVSILTLLRHNEKSQFLVKEIIENKSV